MRAIFASRRKTGRLDLEAVEMAVRSAMHQAGDDLSERFPADTLLRDVDLPTVRAATEIHRGNVARAIELLRAATPYELGTLRPIYVRGQAVLCARSAADAAAQFQKILDHRGVAAVSPFYPMARLELARAWALAGDTDKSRQTYQEFLTLWKDADPGDSRPQAGLGRSKHGCASVRSATLAYNVPLGAATMGSGKCRPGE